MKLYKILKEEFKSNRKYILIFTLLSFAVWSINIIMPKIIGEFIDVINTIERVEDVYNFTLIALALTTLSVVFSYFSNMLKTRITNDISNSMKNSLINKLFITDEIRMNKYDRDYLTQRFFIDVDNIISFSINNAIGILIHILSIILIIILVFRIDIIVGVAVIGFIPIYVILYNLFKQELYKNASKYKEESGLYYSLFNKIVNSTYHIKINALFSEISNLIKRKYNELINTTLKYSKMVYLFNSLGSTLSGYSKIAIIFLGGLQIVSGKMTIGEFTVISTYFSMFLGSVKYFLELGKSYQDTNASLTRISEILQLPEINHGKKIIPKIKSIEVEDLQFFYGDKEVINSLNLEISDCGIYCIEGSNGEGKTSLLNLLTGLFEHQKGKIKINGIDLIEIDKRNLWRNQIAFLEQHVVLFGENIYELLTFGLNYYSEADLKELIKEFELEYLLNEIDCKSRKFSGGERQKISLIRLLLKDASLLVLDEPSTHLDKSAKEKLCDILQKLSKEKIIILVDHDKLEIPDIKYINLKQLNKKDSLNILKEGIQLN